MRASPRLLYGMENNSLRARFEDISTHYTDTERALAGRVEELIWGKLNFTTNEAAYGPLLLDIYYDRTAAEVILARNALERANKERYGPPLGSAPTNGFEIDYEIPLYTGALAAYRSALAGYFTLFTRTRTTANPPNPPVTDNPGVKIFKTFVPGRGLMPAMHTNNAGALVSVTGNSTPLFNGYKDLVFLNGVLREYGRGAETLARLYVARATPADLAAAKAVVTEAQRTLYLDGNLLRGLIPNPGGVDANSGLAASQAGWEKALSTLDLFRQFLDGKANLLGFAPDFLMLVQNQGTIRDSFDSFKMLLSPTGETSPLKLATDALATARTDYATYRGFEEQLQSAFVGVTGEAEDRLFQIVGSYYYPDGDDTPQPGSEASLQQSSIESAQLQIERNRVEISNLKQQVQIEIDRRGQELGINNAIASVQIRYGNKQASITEEISYYEAAQAAANSLAEGANSSTPWGGGAHVGNAVVQAGAELKKGQLQARKERLAAQEAAEITALDDRLLDVTSKANIKTWLLQMNTLVIDSQQAALTLAQEQGRLVALAREKAKLEATIAESDAALSKRYFADPVHRLTAQSDLMKADLAFAEAQKWLFFMARALEYKWNRPFTNWMHSGRTWSTPNIFKLRNAKELEDLYQAMVAFNNTFGLPSRSDDRFDWFSVRENFFGYRRFGSMGEELTYVDPQTGTATNAIGLFRRQLQRLVSSDPGGILRLKFSTVREIEGTSFFQGPRYRQDGSVDPTFKGLYLDKIYWMKIRLPGFHSTTNVPQTANRITGSLSYGGTGYLRNQAPGMRNPSRPDRILNEMTPHSTRVGFPCQADPNQWCFEERQTASVSLLKADANGQRLDGSTTQIDVLPSVQQIDVFGERSVATTDWELAILTGPDLLRVNELHDIEIYFYHYAFDRP